MAESLQKDSWIASISSLTRDLECPVCLETVIPPVKQCINGHVTCSHCAEKLTSCSLCSEVLLKNNPTFVNKLLEALPLLCKYSRQGCKQLCVIQSKLQHERYCGFRSIVCRHTGCHEKVRVNQLSDHYEEHHVRFPTKFSKGEVSFDPFDPEIAQCWQKPMVFDGTLFYLYLHKKATERCWTFLFEAHFVDTPTVESFLSIEMENGEFVASSTIKAVHYEGKSASTLYNIVTNILDSHEDFCMKFPQELVRHLVDDEQKLTVRFSFFKQ